MKKMMNVLIAFVVVVALTAFSSAVVLAQEAKLPKMIRIWTYGTGSTSFYSSMGLAQTISERTGMTVRVIPGGTDMARYAAVLKGQGEIVFISDLSYWLASRGYMDYANPEWGPQPLRLIYGAQKFNMGVMVRGDSDIKAISDIKGKKVPWAPGNPVGNRFNEALLAFGGLTWDDVTKVKFASWSDCMRSVLRGECDAAGTTFTTAACIETAAGPHGIRLLPMPADEKEGWARVHNIAPFMSFHLCTRGPGLSKKNTFPASGYRQPYVVFADLPENIPYAFAKAAYEGYNEFKDRHPDLVAFSPDVSIGHITDYSVPFHPGTIKFFKEIGEWTPLAEKWQQERLLIEKEINRLWFEAPTAAKKAGIKVGKKGWAEFWEKFARHGLSKLELKYAYR